ncbi:metallophosphoesterase [Glycomyces mayteni]|uniref:Metallophosphoesterase n=1 Tax=Glycomyces mayteni TaxID=543887 RepID=A0ABW2D2E0_9ACTN|nr:metallophosphoesterase [Glycomyces mayteni]
MDALWSTVPDIAIPVGFVLLHAYLWLRLVRDTTRRGSRWRLAGGAGLGVLGALGMLAVVFTPSVHAPMRFQAAVGWPGWIWFGVLMYLAGVLLVAEPVRWLLLRRSRVASNKGPIRRITAEPEGTPEGLSRRRVVSRAIGLGATAVALGTVGDGLYEGYRTPRLKPVEVALPRLDRAFDGYRIAIVGDTHFSAIRGSGYCRRVVERINGTQADLIAFVGDLASNEADQLREATEPLAGLTSRDGAFFVSGNAEHYVGADAWYERVEELGMTGLPNTRVELAGFDLAGVNDLIVEQRHMQATETGPDFDAALGDRDPARPVVLLAHQPSAVDRLAGYGVDLQLSGHTHGGQMWPVHVLSRLRSGQLTGFETHHATQVYVTNGAGTNGPPIRIGANADITVMTLRAG